MPTLPRHIELTKEILHELEILLAMDVGAFENNFTIVDSLSAYIKDIFSDEEAAAYEEGYVDGVEAGMDENYGKCSCDCVTCGDCRQKSKYK